MKAFKSSSQTLAQLKRIYNAKYRPGLFYCDILARIRMYEPDAREVIEADKN